MTVKELLHTYQIKPSWLSEKTGLSKRMIGHYKAGTKLPGPKSLSKIQKAIQLLGLDLISIKLCKIEENIINDK